MIAFPDRRAVLVEPTPRWVRVQLGDTFIADSKRAMLVIQYGPNGLPTYYFPAGDVRMDALTPEPLREDLPARRYCTVTIGNRTVERGAWIYQVPPEGQEALSGYVSFDWATMDAWFEESEQVFVHARDPYKRVDVLASSRHVQIVLNGETVADSWRPFLVIETGLPVRYYLPAADVRMDLLERTNHTSRCPYKGVATYYSVRVGETVHENLVWSYPDPILENPKIRGLLSFYNEQVDLYVDGILQDRPSMRRAD